MIWHSVMDAKLKILLLSVNLPTECTRFVLNTRTVKMDSHAGLAFLKVNTSDHLELKGHGVRMIHGSRILPGVFSKGFIEKCCDCLKYY
jgi:hypothetical protein